MHPELSEPLRCNRVVLDVPLQRPRQIDTNAMNRGKRDLGFADLLDELGMAVLYRGLFVLTPKHGCATIWFATLAAAVHSARM